MRSVTIQRNVITDEFAINVKNEFTQNRDL